MPVNRRQGWYRGQKGLACIHTGILRVGAIAVLLMNIAQQLLLLGHVGWRGCCTEVQLAQRVMIPARSAA